MKKSFQTAFLLLFVTFAFGQTTKTISLQKFTDIKVYDRISITLIKADENILVVSGEDKEDVSISQSNGILKIKMAIKEFLSGNHIEATLYFTENLSLIDANENAKITSKEPIKGTKIEVKAQEAAVVSLALDMEYITAKSTSGSNVTLMGNSRVQDVSVNTGGKVYNKALVTKETTVTVLAGGHAEIHGTEKVIAKVKAGGVIIVYGHPKSLEKDDTFGGKIEVIK